MSEIIDERDMPGCWKCGGDCSGAMPPVPDSDCPMNYGSYRAARLAGFLSAAIPALHDTHPEEIMKVIMDFEVGMP